MNQSRSLFAIPVVFLAGIIAAACSSSSTTETSSTNTSSNTSSVTGSDPNCVALATCCTELPSVSQASCASVVSAANDANCATQLATAKKGGFCTSTTSSSSTGITGVSSTSGSGSSTGSTSVSGAGTCAHPGTTLPAGFAGPTGILGPSYCTAAQASGYGACLATPPTTDAGEQSCDQYISVADGNVNMCGQCVFGTEILPDTAIPPTWGYNIIIGVFGTLGDDTSAYLVNTGPSFGGCVVAASTTAAEKKCGLDYMALEACQFAVCLPLCAIPESDTSSTAFEGLEGCDEATQTGACASIITSLKTDCAGIENDAGTDIIDKCNALYNLDLGIDDAGLTGNATQQAALIGQVCGGADAGI